MATKIIHKKSSSAASVPDPSALDPGELALNLADKKIYTKTTGGTVIELADGDKLAGIEAGATADQTASEILTAIKTVDGSGSGLDADLLDGVHGSSYLRSDSNDTTSANLGGGLDSALYGFVLPQNPEGKHIKSPFFFNDIAYSRIRGATVSVDVDGTPMTSTTAIDAMFNASGDFWNMATAGVTTATITVTSAPKTLTYGSYIGISFGNTHWRAKSVTLQYSTDGGTNWTTARAVTNQSEEYVVAYFGMGAGVSASAFRWILSDFNTTSMRVASLFAYNYNSGGMKDLYVSRDGGTIHADISISGNIAVSGTVDGRNVAADGTKLDGIEAGATADQTASEILTAIKTVDGAGSGLDADTLDGQHASAFLTGNQTITLSGDLSGSGTTSINAQIEANAVGASELNVSGNGTAGQYLTSDGDGSFSWATGGGGDAGTLDGIDSSQFLRSDAADTKTSGDLGFSDNVKATFGASSDLQIYHDGSNSYVSDTGTGELVLKGSSISMQNATGTGLISFDQWGAGSWKYEGSNAISVGSSGTTIGWGGLNLGDNTRAYFGNSSDLQIYHDGSNSYIDDTGTGNLQIRGNNLYLQKYTGENYLRALADGAVDLYYNNSSKLATTSTGVSVTGNVAVSGTVDGRDVATDGTKLDGIEAGADVTDTTNVTAALGSISIEAHSDVNTMTPSDGQVLTWDNGNSRWDAATPSGGDLVLLETWTPTAVSSKTFTWDESQYLGIRLVICGISGDGGQTSTSVYGYMGYNNGASFAGGQYEYAFYRDDNGSMYTLNEFTYIPLIASDFFDSVGNDNGLHGTIDVMTPASNDAGFADFGVISNLICSDFTAINCTKTFAMIGPYAGASSTTSTYDSFKIQLASGAFNAGVGEVYVYGYKR